MLGALLWLAAITTKTVPIDLGLRLFVVGIGLGPSQSLFNLAVQNAVPSSQLGIATSASQFFRQMGSVVGLALFGALLTHVLTSELSKRVPELAAMTARIDLSQVQSQALLAMNGRGNGAAPWLSDASMRFCACPAIYYTLTFSSA